MPLGWNMVWMNFLSYKWNTFISFDCSSITPIFQCWQFHMYSSTFTTHFQVLKILNKKHKTKAREYIWKLISFHNFSRKAFFVAYENDINTSATFSRRVYVPLHYQFIWYVHCTHIMYVFFVPFYILMYVFTYNLSCFI